MDGAAGWDCKQPAATARAAPCTQAMGLGQTREGTKLGGTKAGQGWAGKVGDDRQVNDRTKGTGYHERNIPTPPRGTEQGIPAGSRQKASQ